MRFPLLCSTMLVLLAGCAATGMAPDPVVEPDESAAAPVAPAPPQRDLPPIDEEVMYQVFAAEIAGSDGDLPAAVDHYVEAALQSSDPEIAERATLIAMSGRMWQSAAMAAGRWAMLAPAALPAHEAAALSLLRVNDYAAAEWHMQRMLELNTGDDDALWSDLTAMLASSQDPQRAGELLDSLLSASGSEDTVDALLARSRLAARTGDIDMAKRLAVAALAQQPERADLYVWAGRLDLSVGDTGSATRRFGEALSYDPGNAEIGMAYAEMLARDGQLDAAQNVLAELPDNPEMRVTRVAYALRAGDRERAEAVYAGFAGMAGAEDDLQAFHAGRAAELLGFQQQALDWYEQIDYGPLVLEAYTRRAWLESELGNLEASRNLLAAMRLQPDNEVVLESYLAEAEILRRNRNLEEAVEALGEGLRRLGDRTDLRYARALVYVELGNIAAAEADLRWIIQAEPDNATALNALGYTLADRTDRLNEAEALIRQAYALDATESSVIDSMGWVAFKQGRMEEAIQFLQSAWALDTNPEIGAHLAEALWASGDQERARDILREAYSVDAENAVLIDTMNRLGVTP